VHGLSEIADILSRCAIREELYERHYVAGTKLDDFAITEAGYQDALKSLYVEILRFQATCICYMSENSGRRMIDDIVKVRSSSHESDTGIWFIRTRRKLSASVIPLKSLPRVR
jgi:hypothetical protein